MRDSCFILNENKLSVAITYSKMTTLRSRILLLRKIQNNALASIAQRSMGGSPPPWTYLWKPGPYPETEAGMYIILLR